jgi:FkbM family methyltransferase
VVVDVGGHKGYYGAFALHAGAAEVRSFEPEARNFAALQRAAASFGERWLVHQAAVGAAAGQVTLHVSSESAGHSIVHEESDGPRRTLGGQQVPLVATSDVLESAQRPDARLIVKVDAEGAECDIVLGTPIAAWRAVDVIFLEIHDFAACSMAEIVDHLRAAGLRLAFHERDDAADADLIRLER